MSVLSHLDRFFPREVMGGLLVALSGENVISLVFESTIPHQFALVAWVCIFVLSAFFVGYWTAEDSEDNF